MDLRKAFRQALGALTLASALALGAVLIAGAATASAPRPDGKIAVKPAKVAKTAGTAKAEAIRWSSSPPIASTPVAPPPRPARHLIMIPGGGFTFRDASFWPTVAPIAQRAGFVPHLLNYRLFDLSGAVDDARALADELSQRYGRSNVFVYGSSAGGTLATLLASEARVAAAAVSSGLYDLRDFPYAVIERRGPEYLTRIGASWEVRRTLSPIRHRLRCPLLSLHGSWDPIVSVFQAEDYVATHPRATLRLYPAGHGLYRARPNSVKGAFRWLNRVGNKQARLARQPFPRGARAAEAARRIRCV